MFNALCFFLVTCGSAFFAQAEIFSIFAFFTKPVAYLGQVIFFLYIRKFFTQETFRSLLTWCDPFCPDHGGVTESRVFFFGDIDQFDKEGPVLIKIIEVDEPLVGITDL